MRDCSLPKHQILEVLGKNGWEQYQFPLWSLILSWSMYKILWVHYHLWSAITSTTLVDQECLHEQSEFVSHWVLSVSAHLRWTHTIQIMPIKLTFSISPSQSFRSQLWLGHCIRTAIQLLHRWCCMLRSWNWLPHWKSHGVSLRNVHHENFYFTIIFIVLGRLKTFIGAEDRPGDGHWEQPQSSNWCWANWGCLCASQSCS